MNLKEIRNFRHETVFSSMVWAEKVFISAFFVLAITGFFAPALSAQETGANASPALIRGPYLQMGAPNAMMIRWVTEKPSLSLVRYGTHPDSLKMAAFLSDPAYFHDIYLTNLEPDTKYYYSIGDEKLRYPIPASLLNFTTPPKAGTDQKIRAWVLGDCGTGGQGARMVRDAYRRKTFSQKTDLVLLLGDNAYPIGSQADYQRALFQNMYEREMARTVFWSCPGNHDLEPYGPQQAESPYYQIFSFPTKGECGGVPSGTEAYYSFDYGNVHFISLDSQGSDRTENGPMMTWLKQDLAETFADWIIVFFHHPPYSKGSHNSDSHLDSGGRLVDMRQTFLPVLEAGGVDLVLTGHSHSYERSYLLHGHYGYSWTLLPDMVVDYGRGQPEVDSAYAKLPGKKGEGTVYLVAGNAAKLGPGPLNHPAMSYSARTMGSLVLEVEGNRLSLQFLDLEGEIADHFEMVRE